MADLLRRVLLRNFMSSIYLKPALNGALGTSANDSRAVGSSAATLSTALAGQSVPSLPVAALPAYAASEHSVVHIVDPGREGQFVCRRGAAPADPNQGIYIPSSSAGFYWERLWDGTHGEPEWFGAKSSDEAFDNRGAFNACLALCPVMKLKGRTYWIAGTWTYQFHYRSVEGVNEHGAPGDGQPVTVIACKDGNVDLLFVGYASYPGSINAFVHSNNFRNITFYNTGAPRAPARGVQGGSAIVRVRYGLRNSFRECYTVNGIYGFCFEGVVYSQIVDCGAQRMLQASTNRANDMFMGALFDGSLSIPANTSIASCYINKLNVQGAGGGVNSYGFYSADGITDMFIHGVETSNCNVGISLNGKATRFGAEDCIVTGCVLDQCVIGIYVHAPGTNQAKITIANNYTATQFATAGSTGIRIENVNGAVSLANNQILSNGNDSRGIEIVNSAGVVSSGNMISDASRPVRLVDASNCHFTDRILNPNVTAAGPAFQMTGSKRIVCDAVVTGKPDAFADGYELTGPGNSVIEVRVTGVDASCIRTNTINNDRVGIVAAGPFGNASLAQGSFG